MVACLNEVEETETFFISKVQSFSFAFNAVKKMMMMRWRFDHWMRELYIEANKMKKFLVIYVLQYSAKRGEMIHNDLKQIFLLTWFVELFNDHSTLTGIDWSYQKTLNNFLTIISIAMTTCNFVIDQDFSIEIVASSRWRYVIKGGRIEGKFHTLTQHT